MAQTDTSSSRRYIVIAVIATALLLAVVFGLRALKDKPVSKGASVETSADPIAALPLAQYYAGDFDGALQYIDSQPKTFKSTPEARHIKAQILTLKNDAASQGEATDLFKGIKSQSVASVQIWQDVAMQMGNSETDRAAFARKAYTQCRTAYIAKDYPLSQRLCEAALALEPEDKNARQIYAQALYSTGVPEYEDVSQTIFETLDSEGVEAATNWLSAISTRKASREKDMGFSAAMAKYQAKEYIAAKDSLALLLKDNPDDLQLNQLYAKTLVNIGDQDSLGKAKVILTDLEAQDVASAQVWLEIANRKFETASTQDLYKQALAEYRDNDYPSALAVIEDIFSVSPDNARALGLQAQIFARSSDPAQLDAATQYFRGGSQTLDDKQQRWMAIILKTKYKILSWSQILASLGTDASTYELEDVSSALLTQSGSVSEMAQGLRVFVRAEHLAGRNADAAQKRLVDLGAGVNCRQFKSALRSEARALKAAKLTEPELPKCKSGIIGEDNETLFTRLYSSVATLRDADLHMVMFDPDNQDAQSMERQFEIVPPGYTKPFSIVSDADSQMVNDTAAHMNVLQERLGLPISTSIFIVDPFFDPKESKPSGIDEYPTGLYFSFINDGGVFGSDAAAAKLAQDWHRGLYDHYHGWGRGRLNATHILSSPLALSEMESVDIAAILRDVEIDVGVPKQYQKSGLFLDSWIDNRLAVLRLFFTEQPSRETLLSVNLRGREIVYDVNAKGAYVSKVTEDGRELWMAELPIGAGTDVSYAREGSSASLNKNAVTVSIIAPDCAAGTAKGKSCEMTLVKVDADLMGREAAEVTAQWLQDMQLRGVVYTAHGGDRLSSFGPQSYISEQWKTPKPAGKTYVGFDQPLAGAESGKAYIGDLVEDLGVRGVRAFRSDLGPGNVMTPFPYKPLTEKEFGNTVSYMTNWAKTPKLLDGEPFQPELNLQEETIEALKAFDACSFSSASWLPGYIETSLRSKASDYMGGEIWYTHFANKCASNGVRDRDLGFDKTTIKSFNRLSRRSHGLMSDAENQIYPNRLWVLSPSGGFRSRILESEVNRYGLDMETSGAMTMIESRESEFFNGEIFPRKGLATRDLNGLTLPVSASDLKTASIKVDDAEIGALVKTIKDGKGYLTVLDTTDAINVSGALGGKALSTSSKICRAALKPLTLYNISALGFTANISDDLAIEIVLKGKPGSVVFTNAPNAFKGKFESRKNTVLRFEPNGSTRINGKDRFLVPTYDIAQLNGWKEGDIPTMLSGDVDKVCVYSTGGTVRLDDVRAYRYVTSNLLPSDPLLVGGKVKAKRGTSVEDYVARITPKDGRAYFAAVNADGFYYSRVETQPVSSSIDEALKDARVKIDLLRSNKKTGALSRVGGTDVHLLGSRLNIDLKAEE